jgi:cell wall-associated NlpC family hydrolase
MIRRAAAARTAVVVRLAAGERRLDRLAVRARSALDRQQTLAKRKRRERDTVRRQLDEVEGMLASLSPRELAAVERLEEDRSATAQQAFLGAADAVSTVSPASATGPSGVPDPAVLKAAKKVRKPSKAGARAIDYAVAQLGKPYQWGAEGPDTFDCSGLTSQAWAHAGLPIPRTSQLQWKQLPRVPVRNLRPGDLVVYFRRATHVALYIGNGQVVQAPRPGTVVKVSPITANPLLGVVRPDSGAKPLDRYSSPGPSFWPTTGDTTGFSSLTAPA